MSTAAPAGNGAVAARLQKTTAELRELEQAIRAGDIDARVLREFRDAVDHVRQTAWAVQQWVELQAQHRDAYGVLTLLTAERIRRATQLSHDLAMDLDAGEVTFETEGVEKLFRAVQELFERLARLFKK